MAYMAKNFSHLIGLPGFSDRLLENHFKLYEGYVKNTNEVLDRLDRLRGQDQPGPEFAELKRRFGWEWNGMRLHEHYFGNLRKNPPRLTDDSELRIKLKEDFGSYEAWERDFKAAGAMRGIGWVILAYDPAASRLFNVWINEHDLGHLAEAPVLLILDVFEHAFMTDYGTNKADYIAAFFKAVDWETVQNRFDLALDIAEVGMS